MANDDDVTTNTTAPENAATENTTAPETAAAPENTAPTGETLGGAIDPNNSAVKDPSDWVTGDEPVTAAQKSYLDTLAREAGEEISADLTKAEASEQIERLQEKTGRGTS